MTTDHWSKQLKRAEKFVLLMALAQAEVKEDLELAEKLTENEIEECKELELNDMLKRFGAVYDLAVNYRGCMETFGRLPFRNEVLGRRNTQKE